MFIINIILKLEMRAQVNSKNRHQCSISYFALNEHPVEQTDDA